MESIIVLAISCCLTDRQNLSDCKQARILAHGVGWGFGGSGATGGVRVEKLSFIGESGGRILFQYGKLKLLARDWTLHLIDPPHKAPRVSSWHSSWLLSYTDIKSKDRWRRNIPSHPSHGSYIPPPPGILVRYTAIQCGRGVCKPQNSMRCECWSLLQRLSQKWST